MPFYASDLWLISFVGPFVLFFFNQKPKAALPHHVFRKSAFSQGPKLRNNEIYKKVRKLTGWFCHRFYSWSSGNDAKINIPFNWKFNFLHYGFFFPRKYPSKALWWKFLFLKLFWNSRIKYLARINLRRRYNSIVHSLGLRDHISFLVWSFGIKKYSHFLWVLHLTRSTAIYQLSAPWIRQFSNKKL